MTALIRTKLFACFILFALFLILIPTASAQSPTPSASSIPLGAAASSAYTLYPIPSTVSPTSPIYTDLLVNNLFHSFSCLAVGSSIIGQPCLTYQSGIPVLSQANLSGGALGATTSLIGMLYINPPVRTADYLASISGNFRVVKEARAQVGGSGAAVLSPILSLWQVSRNISYVIMIIIFVIIGLMVMFRQRINPQTVITAQAALPGLVIGLILITFSYFLAALITDTAFVGTNVVGYYFSAAQNKPPQDLVEDISNKSIVNLFSKFVGVINAGDISQALDLVFNTAEKEVQDFLRFAAGLMAFQVGNQVGHLVPVIGDIAGIVVGLVVSAGTYIIPAEVFGQVLAWVSMAILIYSMFKLLLRLINNYLSIIFLTITAPFQFLAASLPGRQSIATAWMLNMLCNILAFPAVTAVLYFVAYLLGPNKGANLLTQTKFLPFDVSSQASILSGSTLPLFGGLDTHFINTLLAFGALVALPAVPDIICRTIGRVGAAGQLLGQELSGNIAGGRGYGNQGQQVQQIGTTIGQQYQSYRGKPIDWSPSGELKGEGITIFGRKIVGPSTIKGIPSKTKPWNPP